LRNKKSNLLKWGLMKKTEGEEKNTGGKKKPKQKINFQRLLERRKKRQKKRESKKGKPGGKKGKTELPKKRRCGKFSCFKGTTRVTRKTPEETKKS